MNPVGERIDYCLLGTVTRDLIAGGEHLMGGTGAFSAATARALGLRVGLSARFSADLDLSPLTEPGGVHVLRQPSPLTTTFENRYEAQGRVQLLHARAEDITLDDVPESWLAADIVHLGPLCQDLDPAVAEHARGALLGITPQGWLREWDGHGRVRPCDFRRGAELLSRADAVVLSVEDAGHDQRRIERWAAQARLLVVTDAERGARVFCAGARRDFPAPAVTVADPTGAGDLFATIYFVELRARRDPFEAAERAVWLTSMLLAQRSGRFPDAALVNRLRAVQPG